MADEFINISERLGDELKEDDPYVIAFKALVRANENGQLRLRPSKFRRVIEDAGLRIIRAYG